jgi:PIN domain nuclease of toxin-antitoxin system
LRLLLDTHVLLWRMVGSRRLSAQAIHLMDDEAGELVASAASVWEVAIKWSLRKGAADDMPLSGQQFTKALGEVGLAVLPIKPDHAAATELLPMLHRDPFDRLLLATARYEGLRLMTHDAQLSEYGPDVMVI